METMASVTSVLDVDDTTVDTTTNKLQEKEKQWKRLKILHGNLEQDLDTAETEVQMLMQQRSSLQEENKSLQKEKAKFLDLLKEADKLKIRLEMYKTSEKMAHQEKKQLEKRCIQMEEKADELLTKIYASERENSLLRKDVTRLEQRLLKLESYFDAMNLKLKEKENNGQEVLINKIQELRCQLEESYQEIAMRKEIKERDFIQSTGASDRIMTEIIQISLEKQLEQAQKKKQGQGILFFFRQWLYNMVLVFLWCSFFVGIPLLLFFFLMQHFHALYPDYLLLDLRRLLSGQAIEAIQNILRPFIKLKGVGVLPT